MSGALQVCLEASGGDCALLGLVLGQFLLVLIAQGTFVLLLHLYPVFPSKPAFII